MLKPITFKKTARCGGDLERALHGARDSINSKEADTGHGTEPGNGHDGHPVIVIRNMAPHAPNLTLNVHNELGRGELYLVAVLGTLLQLGVLVFSGFVTYHPSLKFRWLKDGEPVADYSFPCDAIGTLLLVAGMLVCSHVVIITTAFGLRCGSEGAFWGSGVPQQISRAKRATPHVRGLSLQVEGQGPLACAPNPAESRA